MGSVSKWSLVKATETSPLVMIEYSSPNTNKPLHLGHVRNNLLGNALANIVAANGNKVVKTNIVNDRGIHICKSMLAWKKYGNGETPESTGKKGDHLVGDYYVSFDKHYKAELAELMEKGMTKEEAEAASPLMQEAREMLVKWEAGDPEALGIKLGNGFANAPPIPLIVSNTFCNVLSPACCPYSHETLLKTYPNIT